MIVGNFGKALALAVALNTPAKADTLDWAKNKDQLGSISRLGARFAAAILCDYNIDMDKARATLLPAFGPTETVPANAIADSMFIVSGMQSMQVELQGLKTRDGLRRYCAKALELWGPRGTEQQGLMSANRR